MKKSSDRKTFLARIAFVGCISTGVSGCDVWKITYRYKISLCVNTLDGPKTASSVGEVTVREAFFLEHGYPRTIKAEAVYLDLGPNRRPLVALLRQRASGDNNGNLPRWGYGGPEPIFASHYGRIPDVPADASFGDRLYSETRYWIAHPEKFGIEPSQLPELVTFDDPANPASVRTVAPWDLKTWLGPDASWCSSTLEIVNEPVTRTLETKLRWLTSTNSPSFRQP